MLSIAKAYEQIGKNQEAYEITEKCYKKVVSIYGESHPDSIDSLTYLAKSLLFMGDHKKAQ